MKLIIFLCSLFFGVNGFCGGVTDISGGGHGYKKNGKVYLLDLVESDISKPFLNLNSNENFCEKLKTNVLSSLNEPILSRKYCQFIVSVSKIDTLAADLFLLAAEYYDWRIINQTLSLVEPVESLLQHSRSKVVQLATRKGESIYIDGHLWSQMDMDNKLALVVHEVISSLTVEVLPASRHRWLVGSFLKLVHELESQKSNLPIQNNKIMGYFAFYSRFKAASALLLSAESDIEIPFFWLDENNFKFSKSESLTHSYLPIVKVDFVNCHDDFFNFKKMNVNFLNYNYSNIFLENYINGNELFKSNGMIPFAFTYIAFRPKLILDQNRPILKIESHLSEDFSFVNMSSSCSAEFSPSRFPMDLLKVKAWQDQFLP